MARFASLADAACLPSLRMHATVVRTKPKACPRRLSAGDGAYRAIELLPDQRFDFYGELRGTRLRGPLGSLRCSIYRGGRRGESQNSSLRSSDMLRFFFPINLRYSPA